MKQERINERLSDQVMTESLGQEAVCKVVADIYALANALESERD